MKSKLVTYIYVQGTRIICTNFAFADPIVRRSWYGYDISTCTEICGALDLRVTYV